MKMSYGLSSCLMQNSPNNLLITLLPDFSSIQRELVKRNSCLVFKIMALIFRGYLDYTPVLDKFTHNLLWVYHKRRKSYNI